MEEEKVNDQQVENDYLDQIKKLKENTVSREEYDKLRKEHKKLLNDYVAGNYENEENPEKRDIEVIKKELFKRDISDVKYAELSLELRERVMEETGEDIFVGNNPMNPPTDEDYKKAQHVADVLQDAVDYSGGNNVKFIAELSTRINDVPLPTRRNNNKKTRR